MSITMVEQLPGYGPPTPVPIFQWSSEFETLLELYRRFSPRQVLEIGTYHGGTLYHWLTNAQPELVVTVDSYAVGVDNRHLYDEWVPSLTELHVIEGDSRDPAVREQVAAISPSFDWVFIDAGHYYAEVKSDWETFRPLARRVVVLHDILPPTQAHPEIEVAYLWNEIKQTHRTLEIVENRGAEWGGLGVVLV